MKEKNTMMIQDYDPEIEEWMEDNAGEAMEAMTEFLKVQQKTALGLTELVLTHCKEEKITKEKIFTIFQEAAEVVGKNLQ